MSRYRNFSKFLESSLLKFCILGILGLFVVQFLKLDKDVAVFLDQSISDELMQMDDSQVGYIIFKKSKGKYDDVEIIINNKSKYKFKGKDELTLKIHQEDLIEIDGSMYDENIDINIIGITRNIQKPILNSKLTTKGTIETFGTVELKNIE